MHQNHKSKLSTAIYELVKKDIICISQIEVCRKLAIANHVFNDFLIAHLDKKSWLKGLNEAPFEDLPTEFVQKEFEKNYDCFSKHNPYISTEDMQNFDNLTRGDLYFSFLKWQYNKSFLQKLKDALIDVYKDDPKKFVLSIFHLQSSLNLAEIILSPIIKIHKLLLNIFTYFIETAAQSRIDLKHKFSMLNVSKFLITLLLTAITAPFIIAINIVLQFSAAIVLNIIKIATHFKQIFLDASTTKSASKKEYAFNNLKNIATYLLGSFIPAMIISGGFFILTNPILIIMHEPILAAWIGLPIAYNVYKFIKSTYNDYMPLKMASGSGDANEELLEYSNAQTVDIPNDLSLHNQLQITKDNLQKALDSKKFIKTYKAMKQLNDYIISNYSEKDMKTYPALKLMKAAISGSSPLSYEQNSDKEFKNRNMTRDEENFVNMWVKILTKALEDKNPTQNLHIENHQFSPIIQNSNTIIFSLSRISRRVQNNLEAPNGFLSMEADGKYQYKSHEPTTKKPNLRQYLT